MSEREPADGTVEWGEKEASPGWMDRILGTGDQTRQRRLSTPAVTCAALAVACLFAAELLPWMTVDALAGATTNNPFPNGDGPNFAIEQIGGIQLVGYYLGWLVLAALVGFALVVPGERRKVAVSVGIGVAVVLVIIVAGLTRRVLSGGDQFGNAQLATSPGPGLYFAFGAAIVGAGALLLTGWRPGRRRPAAIEDDVAEADLGPADLTVTSFQQAP